MNTFDLFAFFPAVNWFVAGAALAVVAVLAVLAVVALIRATRNASEIEGLDTGTQSPLSLTARLEKERLETAELPTAAAPIPAVQIAAVSVPEPTPLTPVQMMPHPSPVEAVTENLPVNLQTLPDTEQFALMATVEEDAYNTGENTLDPTGPRSAESLLARQIAEQIAERRAKLSSSEQALVAEEAPATESPWTEISPDKATTSPSLPKGSPVPKPVTAPTPIAVKTARLAKSTEAPMEQLPPPTRKLKPPMTASVNLTGDRMRLAAPETGVLPSAARTAALPPTERVPQLHAAGIVGGVAVAVPSSVETFEVRNRPSAFVNEAVPPSFLTPGASTEKTDISLERRGVLKLIAGLAVVFGAIVLTFIPHYRNKLPLSVASKLAAVPIWLGVEQPPPPPVPPIQVEVREYEITYKPTQVKDQRTALVGGVVKNITTQPLTNLRIEMELFKRNVSNETAPEIRIVPLDAATLVPGQEGGFLLEIPDKDYMLTRFNRVLAQDGSEIRKTYVKEKVRPSWATDEKKDAQGKK